MCNDQRRDYNNDGYADLFIHGRFLARTDNFSAQRRRPFHRDRRIGNKVWARLSWLVGDYDGDGFLDLCYRNNLSALRPQDAQPALP